MKIFKFDNILRNSPWNIDRDAISCLRILCGYLCDLDKAKNESGLPKPFFSSGVPEALISVYIYIYIYIYIKLKFSSKTTHL